MIKCSDISKSDTRYKTEIETKIILTLSTQKYTLHKRYVCLTHFSLSMNKRRSYHIAESFAKIIGEKTKSQCKKWFAR